MAAPSPPARRPINPEALTPYSADQKLARPIQSTAKRSVSIGRDQLIPVVQAEVGAEVPVPAYHYRIFVPVAQVVWESPSTCRRITIASDQDIETLRDLLIRDFGGVPTLKQNPPPCKDPGLVT